MSNDQAGQGVNHVQGGSYRVALILITSLFFMWGLSYGLLDVLNKHFQEALEVSKAQSGLLQAAYFGAYFVVAVPAAIFMEHFGYKPGILLGLGLFAVGALLFIPASGAASFALFLFALFVLASGLGCLETAANPYATILGSEEGAARRLNLAQSFNGLGSFVGPLIGGTFFFSTAANEATGAVTEVAGFDGVRITYIAIAAVVVILALLIARIPLPDIRESDANTQTQSLPLSQQRHYVNGVITLFFYVAAQVGLGAFFINYAMDHWGSMTASKASYWLSVAMLCYMVGRFVSTALMKVIAPRVLLAWYALVNVALMGVVVSGIPVWSVIALVLAFLFMSIMFPTIFALSLERLGSRTKRGSSYLIMAIVGGAIAPSLMGWIADSSSIEQAFWLPLGCFVIVFWFAKRGSRLV